MNLLARRGEPDERNDNPVESEVRTMNDDQVFSESDVIFSYTRSQAIEDGVLVDLSEWARETGFRFPVACTRAVWERCIVPPD